MTYSRGPLSLAWTEQWRSATKRNLDWVTGIDIDNNRIASQSMTNLRATYNLDTAGGATYSLYAAVSNALNRNPSRVMGLNNIWGDIGRHYTVGLRYRH